VGAGSDSSFPRASGALCCRWRSPARRLGRDGFFLARETNGEVAEREENDGPFEALRARLGDFDLDAAPGRADASIWRQATLDDPYPNLKGRGRSR
jgi:hypothetical protein